MCKKALAHLALGQRAGQALGAVLIVESGHVLHAHVSHTTQRPTTSHRLTAMPSSISPLNAGQHQP
jgi:hypothetical protein